MRRPHIEAAALLGAAGFAPLAPADLIRRPAMPRARFLLFDEPTNPIKPPAGVFRSLSDLAMKLHRLRKQAGLQVLDAQLQFAGDPAPRNGASVWTLTETGDRRDYLGWCYLDGAGARTLQDALFAARPQFTGEEAA